MVLCLFFTNCECEPTSLKTSETLAPEAAWGLLRQEDVLPGHGFAVLTKGGLDTECRILQSLFQVSFSEITSVSKQFPFLQLYHDFLTHYASPHHSWMFFRALNTQSLSNALFTATWGLSYNSLCDLERQATGLRVISYFSGRCYETILAGENDISNKGKIEQWKFLEEKHNEGDWSSPLVVDSLETRCRSTQLKVLTDSPPPRAKDWKFVSKWITELSAPQSHSESLINWKAFLITAHL